MMGMVRKADALTRARPEDRMIEFERRLALYHESARPIRKALVRLTNAYIPRMLVFPNGEVVTEYPEAYLRARADAYEVLEGLSELIVVKPL